MNVEHRTSNVQHRIMNSANLIKDWAKRIYPSKFDSAESLGPESFNPELTTEGPVAGCDSLVLKSVKRSVINIQRSMLDVRCSTFNLFAVTARWSFMRPPPVAASVQSDRKRNFDLVL